MLYIPISVLFFLLSIRAILFWTAVWQKSGYKWRYLPAALWELSTINFLTRVVFLLCLFALVLFYGFVIINDSTASLYRAGVFIFFIIGTALYIREARQGIVVKPIFGIKALIITAATLFFVSFFYMIPLTDKYLWLLIILVGIPGIILFLVILLGFPSEIYEDYLLQKVKKSLSKSTQPFSIAVVGSDVRMHTYFSLLLESSQKHTVHAFRYWLIDTLHGLEKTCRENADVYIYSVSPYKDEAKKLRQLFQPHALIFSENSKGKNKEKYYYELLSHVPKKTTLVCNMENKTLRLMAKRLHKHLTLFGTQKFSLGEKVTIVSHIGKKRNEYRPLTITIGKDEIKQRVSLSENEIISLLPVVYMMFVLKMPIKNIQKMLAYL